MAGPPDPQAWSSTGRGLRSAAGERREHPLRRRQPNPHKPLRLDRVEGGEALYQKVQALKQFQALKLAQPSFQISFDSLLVSATLFVLP